MKTTCKCGQPTRSSARNCLACHAAGMRRTRPTYKQLDPDARRRSNARSYAHVYARRGWLKRSQCSKCGADSQMHHPNYEQPLNVVWLCRPCHLALHALDTSPRYSYTLTMEQTLPYHSNPDFIAAFNANLDRDSIPGCALWRGALSTGYGRTQLPDGRIRPAHAVALEIHLGRELAAGEGWGGKLQANHRDDLCQRRDCCSAAHLYEGTHKQNIHDSIASGRSTKGKKLPVEVLTATDIQALLRACNRGPTGARNQALIILLWRGGLRISEALALRPTDIDIERGTISVLRGKGSKQRQAALDPWAAGILKNWLTIRSPLPGSTAFCTLDGSPIGLSYIRALLPRLARIAGVEKRVHAHAFRHTHAVELMQERVPLNLISKQLGHSNVATTAVYLAHVSPPEMLAAVQSRPPPF